MCPTCTVLIDCLATTNQFLALLFVEAQRICRRLVYILRTSAIRIRSQIAKNGFYKLIVSRHRHGKLRIDFVILKQSLTDIVLLCMVPEAGIEPARLAAGDFLTTSAFAAIALKAMFVVWSTPLP